MRFKRVISGAFIILFIVSLVSAQNSGVSMKRVGKFARVYRGEKLLFKVALRGTESSRRKHDEAFMVGRCLAVRRDVVPTELFPEVSRLEIYQLDGSKRVYLESDIGIRRFMGEGVLASPNMDWAIVPDEEEGELTGFFHVSQNCEIRENAFPPGNVYSWGDELGGRFIDESTLRMSLMLKEASKPDLKTVHVFIKSDGKFSIEVL